MRHGIGERGFTLLELLVVVAIIILVLGMAIPGLQVFLKGQRLDQSGRVIQTAFNEARRASITMRAPHRIIVYRYPENDQAGAKMIYAMRVYSDADGFGQRKAYVLPRTIKVSAQPNGIQIGDGEPQLGDPRLDAGAGKVEFRKDGTVEFSPPVQDQPTIPRGFESLGNIFDPNNANPDRVGVPENFPADVVLEQDGETKRCFIDIVPNTGRMQFRIAQVAAAAGP